MARPCSQDLRDRVLASVDDGMSSGEVAELFQVDVSYVYKVVICRRTTNALPRPRLRTNSTIGLRSKPIVSASFSTASARIGPERSTFARPSSCKHPSHSAARFYARRRQRSPA
jgi:hypothetical protein